MGSVRFTTDRAGYAAMRSSYAKTWPDRVWAVEGANGAGRPLAQRLLEAGEHVVDVPAKLAAGVKLFDTGHNRKTDARDAHSIAIVAVRTKDLRVLQVDGELEALRILTDRREALTRRRDQTVDRLQALLAELHGIGPVVAARILADVGDVARFADRNRFASHRTDRCESGRAMRQRPFGGRWHQRSGV